jgi:hypothetical protein
MAKSFLTNRRFIVMLVGLPFFCGDVYKPGDAKFIRAHSE